MGSWGRARNSPISSAQKFVQYQQTEWQAQMAPRSLKNDPKKREKRLKELSERLEAGQDVQNRDIEKVLTAEEWTRFNEAMQGVTGSEEVAAIEYPDVLDSYFLRIDEADSKYEALARALSRDAARYVTARLSNEADGLYERARERLEEILGLCSAEQRGAVEYWLDRPIEHSEANALDIGLDPTTVPRRRGSRSKYTRTNNAGGPTAHEQKRQIKLGHLTMALDILTKSNQASALSKEAKTKLDDLRKLARR